MSDDLFEFLDTGADDVYRITANKWKAMTFTVGTAGPNHHHTITSVKCQLHRSNTPGTLYASIRAVDGTGSPTGGPDLSTGSTDGDTLPTVGSEWREIALSEYTLLKNTQYALVLAAPDGTVDVDVVWWHFHNTGITPPALYAGGHGYVSIDSGSTWPTTPEEGAAEFMFYEYGLSKRNMTVSGKMIF